MPFFRFFALLIIGMFTFAPLSHAGYCGDGAVNDNEQCDDGNFVDRDGCSARCEIEDLDPPTVESISIPDGTTEVSTLMDEIVLVFNEPVKESTLTKDSVKLKHDGEPLEIEWSLGNDGKSLTITILQELFSEATHAVDIQWVQDLETNLMTEKFFSSFTTAVAIDHTPPNVVVSPPGGTYSFPQEVKLKPYVGEYTASDEFLDETATIYYTLNSTNPTKASTTFDEPLEISTQTTLRYFSEDGEGNRSEIFTETYKFDCAELANAKKISRYPKCRITECNPGYRLQNNVCILLTSTDDADYKSNAVTAPLLASDTPVTISTKPAIHITTKHRGVIPRPVKFIDKKSGIVVKFPRDTEIRDSDGKLFSGYIVPPDSISIKGFPINFGYTNRAIIEFKSADGRELVFDPHYEITIPYSTGFKTDEESKIFTFDDETETYTAINPDHFGSNLSKKEVTIIAQKSNRFFVTQKGRSFNRSVFKDTDGHWSKNYVEHLYRRGIVKGKAKGVYAPDDPLTRAEFTKIALKAIDAEVQNADDLEDTYFRDVPLYAWYTPYVNKAKELGLIKGYADGTFRPDRQINRAEATKLLLAAFEFELSHREETEEEIEPTLDSFADLSERAWYFPYIDFAIQNELMGGLRSGGGRVLKTFKPANPITRGEMAKFAIKTLELFEKMNEK